MEKKTIVVEVESNLGSLRSQLKQATAAVAEMSEKFGATSVEAINAAKAAARLKDTIGDAKQLTDAFNPDAKFKALTASISGSLNGFQAVQGAMGLFGAEGAEVQAMLLKVQSAMALTQGIDGVLEAKDAFKTFGATAVNAFKSIGAAIKANPLGLLLTAIALAAAAFTYLATRADEGILTIRKGYDNAIKKLGEYTAKVSRSGEVQNKITERHMTALDMEGRKRIAMGENSIKVQKEINERKIQELQINIQNDKQEVANLRTAKEKTLEIKKQSLAKLEQQMLDAIADGKASLTTIGQTAAIKKLAEARLQYQQIEKAAGKETATTNKEISKRVTEINANKDAISNLKIANMELNKTQSDEAKSSYNTAKDLRAKNLEDKKQAAEDEKALDDKKRAEDIAFTESIKMQQRTVFIDEKDLLYQQEVALGVIRKTARDKDFEEDKKRAAEKIALEKQVRDTKIQMASDALNVVGELANALAGKSEASQRRAFNINKAASIAQATISTYQAAQSAYASQMTIPSPDAPIRAAVSAGIAIASGLAKVAMIAKTKFSGGSTGGGGGGGSSGGGSGGGGSSSGAQSNPANFNIVGNSGTNQLIEGLQNAPLKAYVVGGDVTSQQSLDRNKITTATI